MEKSDISSTATAEKFENAKKVVTTVISEVPVEQQLKKPSQPHRFQVCTRCDQFFETANEDKHDCVTSLREKMKRMEDDMSNMLTKEEMASILTGYVPMQTLKNYVLATETKFSELFDMINTHDITIKTMDQKNKTGTVSSSPHFTCFSHHSLTVYTGTRLPLITCDVCKVTAAKKGSHVIRCDECDFDVCARCEEAFSKISICVNPRDFHPAAVANPDKINTAACKTCLQNITSPISLSCDQCNVVVCQNCIFNKSRTSSFFSALKSLKK